MGKGDKKTRRGKIVIGSYGVRRPRKNESAILSVSKKASSEKAVSKKGK